MKIAVIGDSQGLRTRALRLVLLVAIATSFFWVATGSQPQHASASSNLVFLSDCDFGFHAPNYQSNEVVCVTGRVSFHQGEFLVPSGDIFVTPNLTWVDKAILEIKDPSDPTGPPLLTNDVTRGGANTVVGPGLGGAFFDEFVWLPELAPGDYDIVLDDNKNGIYDATIDYVIGGGSGFAFRVRPAPLGAFVVDVDKIKGGAAVEKENWEGAKNVYRNIGIMKDALNIQKDLYIASSGAGAIGYQFVKGKIKGKIPVLKDIKKVDYNDAVMAIGKQMISEVATVMITHYDDLVNDPADPDFEQMIALDIGTVDAIVDAAIADLGVTYDYPYQPLGQRPLEAAYIDLASRLLEQAAIVRALIQSHEKYLGARDVDNLEWAVIHANGMVRFSNLLEENLLATNESAVALKAAMLALPGGLKEFEAEFLKAIQDHLQNGGFTEEEILELHNAGWTDTDIANLTTAALAEPIPDANFTGPGTVDELIATNIGFLPDVQQLGADAQTLRDNLEFFVFDLAEPVADAGGPYAAGTGATVPLDGSASISNGTSLTYEWDTDVDGVFDDLTSSTPSAVFTTPGDRLVGLRVTNDLGLIDIDYALVQVSLTNQSPVIDSFTPAELDVRVDVGDVTPFTVAATDPETEALSFEWLRNGVVVGSGTNYSYTATSGDLGIQLVRVRVSDTDPFSPDTFQQREVAVRSGDADLDLYHSNFDCNDGDPDINPGAPEIVGDGINNDCDDATPDTGQSPIVGFATNPVIPVFGLEAEFHDLSTDANDDIVSWDWDFGDGNSSTLQNPVNTYATGGLITVSLTVRDAQSNEVTTTRDYTIPTPPAPAFSVDPNPAQMGEPAQFTDLSVDTDGTIIDWKWDFDDDGLTDSELQNPEFTFGSTGLFPVTLAVTDNDGVPVSLTSDVLVAQRPIPSFDFVPTVVIPGVEIQFQDTSTDDGTIVLFEWDFEDDGVFDDTGTTVNHTFPDLSVREVRLRVTDDDGAVATTSQVIIPAPGAVPVPLFSFDPTPLVVGETANFTDESTDADNAIVGWEWDFENDGVVDSTLQNPTHVFPSFGPTDVLLRVTDQASNQGELVFAGIPVRARPVASFDTSNTSPAVGETISFSDTSTDPDSPFSSFVWDFGDGTGDTGQTPTHAYSAGGTFTVTLTATDVHSLSSTASQVVVVTDVGGPTADFSFLPSTPVVGASINFTDESTDDGSLVSWAWDFDEDGIVDSITQSPSTSFPVQGTFTVELTVVDDDLNVDVVSRDIVIGLGDPPVANFTLTPSVLLLNEPTFFTDLSIDTDNEIVSFDWDFGDGGTSGLRNPTHIFTTLGTKNVALTVIDQVGNSDTLTITEIPILARPVADFSFAPVGSPPITTSTAIQFTNLSTDADDAITIVAWDFEGDGDINSLTPNPPPFTFPTGGTFDTTLTVSDGTGLTDTITRQVVVILADASPTADFTFDPPVPAPNEQIQFTDQSTDDIGIVTWEWDFEDDGVVDSTVQNPSHLFPTGGDFDVKLTVTDAAAGSDTVIRAVSIPTKPLAAFTTSRALNRALLADGAEIVDFSSVATSTPASNAIDKFSSSAWESREGRVAGEFIEIELVGLSLHSVDAVFVEGGPSTDAIQNFEVFVSEDGTPGSFSSVTTGTAPQSSTGVTVNFTAIDARFARLVVTDNYGQGHVRVEQFEVLDTGAVNVAALDDGATVADFSSVLTSNPPVLAIDSNENTHWSPVFGSIAGEFITVKLTDQDVDLHVIDRVSVEGHNGNNSIRGFDLQVSTTGTAPGDFTTVVTGEVARDFEKTTISFPPVHARFVKLVILSNWGNATQTRVDRFEVWSQLREGGIVSLLDGPQAKVVDVSSERSTGFAVNAIDDSFNSIWWTETNTNEFITVELAGGFVHTIDTLKLRSSSAGETPKNFDLLVSTTDAEDASFSVAFSGIGASNTSTQTFNFPPVEARFIKLFVHDVNNTSACCTRLAVLEVLNSDGGNAARQSGLGAIITEFSSAANTTTARPHGAIDLSNSGGWTTANGGTTDQFFKVALTPGNAGPPYLVNQVALEGTSGTSGVKDFEIWASNSGTDPGSGIADPNFHQVLTGSLFQQAGLRWFEFAPVEATHLMFVARNNHGSVTNMFLDRFRAYAIDLGSPSVPFEDRSEDPGGSIVSWDWDFGDGATSTERNPKHQYAETGVFPVSLTVTDDEGKSDTATIDYAVLQGPVADFVAETFTPFEGQTDRLDDTSTDEGGPVISKVWSLSYNLSLTPTFNAINATFPDNGEFTVSITVRDQQLLTDIVTKTFNVVNLPPSFVTSRMDNTPDTVTAVWGESLRMGGSWSDVSPDNSGNAICDVDYGDGTTLQLENCSAFGLGQNFHTYDLPGDYVVTLTITDKDGDWGTDTQDVRINRRDTHTTIWGADALRPPDGGGSLTAFARLIDFDVLTRGIPLEGEVITFSLAGVTQDVVTDVNGEAQATFDYAIGQIDHINANFAGNTFFEPSRDRPFITGDIVAAVGKGMAHRFAPDGTFINVFDSTTGSRETAGMCFDSDGNLYLTSFQLRLLSKFDRTTGVTSPEWATGFSAFVESCVLGQEDLDGDGTLDDVLFTGEVDGANDIRKFDRSGTLLQQFDVVTRDRGADWIDLTIDEATGDFILYYTTEGDDILRYDLTNDVQLPDFVPDQSVEANQLVPKIASLPENAIDDDINSAWVTHIGHIANEFITVELVGGTQTIDRVFTEAGFNNTGIRNFEIQVSTTGTEDADFTTVFTGVSPRNGNGLEHSFTAVDAKFVRLFAIDNHNDSNRLRVEQFRALNTAGDNVASLTDGATIADFSSVENDPLLIRPCFAMRVLPDGSAMTACRSGVAHVAADGLSLVNFFPVGSLIAERDDLFALNLDPDGTSFWTAGFNRAPVVKVDIATGTVLLRIAPMRRGPTVAGLIVFDEPLAGINQVPIANSDSVSTDEDTPLPITLTGSDLDGEPLTFTVETPPIHGDLSGTAPDLIYTADPDYVGPDSLLFRVNDGVQDSDIAVIDIDVLLVNSPPVADTGGPYVDIASAVINLDGTDSFDNDADDAIVSFEWDLDDDGQFDDSTLVDPTISFANPGGFTVSLRVTDNHGTSGVESTSILINGDPPVVDAGVDQTITPGEAVNLDPATFTDTGLADTHTATIDWGDGTLEPGTLTQSAGSGTVDGSHTYISSGVFVAQVCVTDSDGLTGCDSLEVTVENAAPTAVPGGPYSVDEGGTVALDGSGSTDSDGTIVTFEWDLDGDDIFGETGADAAGGDETGPTPTLDARFIDGQTTITISLRVIDDGGETDTATADVDVANVAPTVSATGETIDEGSEATVTVNFTDPFIFDSFLATIDWDEGLGPQPVGAVGPPGTPFAPTHVYEDDGIFDVTVTVTDDDGGIGQATATVTVNNVAPTGSFGNDGPVDEGSQASVSFTGVTDPSSADTTAGFLYSFDFGDDGSIEVVDSPVPIELVPLSLTSDGPVFVPVRGFVSDDDGGVSDFLTQVEVLNIAPTVTTSGDTTIDEGGEATVDSSFTDPGTPDTHTSVIDWGDGTVEPVTSTHVYEDDGIFDVTVTVTDDDGGIGQATATITVNNVAPTGSFGNDGPVDEGSQASVSFSGVTDPSSADTTAGFLYSFDFGDDGSIEVVDSPVPIELVPLSLTSEGPVFVPVRGFVSDDDGGISEFLTQVEVLNVAPTGSFGNNGPVDEGSQASVNFSGVTDPSSADTTAGFLYSFDFGDDGSVEVVDSPVPIQLVQLSLTSDGPITVPVRGFVSDDDGGTSEFLTEIQVLNVAPTPDAGGPYDVGEGSSVGLLGSATDPAGVNDTLAFEWDLDEDGIFGETGVNAANGDETGATPTFDASNIVGPASIEITLRVSDEDGGQATDAATVDVIDLLEPVSDPGGPYFVNEGATIQLDGTGSSDPDGAIVLFEWDLDEDGVFGETGAAAANGDETGATPLFDTSGAGIDVIGVFLRVVDNDGLEDTQQSTVTIVDLLPPLSDPSGPYQVDEGDSVQIDGTGSFDPDGTIVLFEWDLDEDGIFGETGAAAANGDETGDSPVFDASLLDGPQSITVSLRVTDNDGGIGQATATVTVNNVAPTVTTSGDTTIDEGGEATVDSSFTDPGTPDTHTSVIDWGDGTVEPVTSTHVYEDDGIFDVTVTVTDDDGGIGQATATVTVNNVAPTGSFGNNGPVDEGSQASVSFSGVTDPSSADTTAGFLYSFDFGDDGSIEVVDSPVPIELVPLSLTSEGPVFVPVRGFVSDDDGGISEFLTQVEVLNVAPTGSFGNNGPVDEGSQASVSFTGVTDPSSADTTAGFLYSFDFGDDGSVEVVDSPVPIQLVQLSLTSDGPITIPVRGFVSDDDGGVSEFLTEIQVLNVAPTPDAGGPFDVDEGLSVGLLGSATDPAGVNDTLTFEWDLDEDGIFGETGVNAANGDETGATPTFDATNLFGPASISVSLRVSDEDGGQATDTATVEINVVNDPPIADAGGPYSVDEGSTVALVGTGSDPDGVVVLYEWDFDGDGTFDFASPTSGLTLFDATLLTGPDTIIITLRVTDDEGLTDTDTATVEVVELPDPVLPFAVAGGPYSVDEGSTVALIGTGSDEDGVVVLYEWDFDGDGTFDFASPTSGLTTFDATLLDGPDTTTLTLRVTDDDGGTDEATATVTVNNVAPTGSFGNNGPVDEGSQASVSFTGVTDPSSADTTAGFLYSFDFGDDGSVEVVDSPVPIQLVQLSLTSDGPKTVPVRGFVSDDDGGASEFLTEIQVLNVAPTPDAGGPYNVDDGSSVGLLGSATDPAGVNDSLTFEWDLDGDGVFGETGADAANGDETGRSPTFDALNLTGPLDVVVLLRVTDDDGASGLTEAVVSVAPVDVSRPPLADAGGPYEVDEGDTVQLDGTGSSDPDGTIATFEWDLDGDGIFGETGTDAGNGDETGATPVFDVSLLDGPQIITVSLRVTDTDALSDTDTATVTVRDLDPPPAVVDSLGPPTIPLASGTSLVAAGTGMFSQPGSIHLFVPADAEVRQVLLYWEGQFSSEGDDTISINGHPVIGTSIGGPTVFFSSTKSQTFRADITALDLVSTGSNAFTIEDMEFNRANNGAGIVVVIDDGTQSHIDLRDGNDLAFVNFNPPLDTTVPQALTFEPAAQRRIATLSMFFSSVSDDGATRPSSIEITTGGVTTVLTNRLGSVDGGEWDTLNVDIEVPAGASSITVQAFSRDDNRTRKLPASFAWNMLGLSLHDATPPPPPGPDLIGHWTFDDGSGTDSSGNGHNGVVNGTVLTAGRVGAGALEFDGDNDFVDAGNIGLSGNAVTLAAWINSDDLANCGSSDCRIASSATGIQEQDHYIMLSTIKSRGGVKLRFRLKAGGTTETQIAPIGNLANGEWYHVAAVYDGSDMRLYLNGVEVGAKAKTGVIDTAPADVPFWIGGNPDSPDSRPWDGRIDEVRLYGVALDLAAIQTLASVGAPPPPPGSDLIGHWTFDDGNGTDSSGSGHNGVVNGAVLVAGKVGAGALDFDGADDHVDAGNISLSGNALTLAAWINSDDLNNCGSSDCRIASSATGVREQDHYIMLSTIESRGGVKLRFRLKAGGTTETLIAPIGDLANGEWYHVAAVYDGSDMRLYLNGVEVGAKSKTGAVDTAPADVPFWIGGNPDSPESKPWDGRLDEVRLYDRALDSTEIQVLAGS